MTDAHLGRSVNIKVILVPGTQGGEFFPTLGPDNSTLIFFQ